MDFLGIGLPELITIIILAIIFIGPRDLPKMAGRAAKFLRDLRMMSEGFTTEWRREITAVTRIEGLEELKEEWNQTQKSIKSVNDDIKNIGKSISKEIDAATAPKPVNNSIAPPPQAEPPEAPAPVQPANDIPAENRSNDKQVNSQSAALSEETEDVNP